MKDESRQKRSKVSETRQSGRMVRKKGKGKGRTERRRREEGRNMAPGVSAMSPT
jgi:hypothetical protein